MPERRGGYGREKEAPPHGKDRHSRRNDMQALVLSQVTLSLMLPVAIIPMLLLSGRKELMGELANKCITNIVGWLVTAVIIGMNAVLLYLTFAGKVLGIEENPCLIMVKSD